MANKSVFKAAPGGKTMPKADTVNRAGGKAYSLSPKAAIAQYAATGTFNDQFYVTGENLLDEALEICKNVDPEFLAKTAMYSREAGRMKDMPAFICAVLASRKTKDGAPDLAAQQLLKRIFPVVIDNGRMLRNFVQMIRSGKTGRKSFGTMPKKLVQSWFDSKPVDAIFKMSMGNDPSMADIIKLTRPRPTGPDRQALYGYLADVNPEKTHKDKAWGYDKSALPPLVQQYEAVKAARAKDPKAKVDLPRLPWEMVTGLPLTDKDWETVALNATWTQLRMNLNTFARHGVFKNPVTTKLLAAKLKDKEEIEKAKPFPYQLFIAYLNTLPNQELNQLTGGWHHSYAPNQAAEVEAEVPQEMRNSLHVAAEYATANIPTIDGAVYVGIDVSGSMQSPITGTQQKGVSSKARCVDVASLIGCSFFRKNAGSMILPFSDNLFLRHGLEPMDSVFTNAKKLASLGGGGTNMSSVLDHLNKVKAMGNLVIFASDTHTWMDSGHTWGGETSVAAGWATFKKRNPKAKLVSINLQAGATCQVQSNPDVLNIGGFSDAMWEVIKKFVEGVPSSDYWVEVIEKMELPQLA